VLRRGLAAICVGAWHTRAALSAMRNKTDKADARGIAHIMRAGWFREVLEGQELILYWTATRVNVRGQRNLEFVAKDSRNDK
jgi:transposase